MRVSAGQFSSGGGIVVHNVRGKIRCWRRLMVATWFHELTHRADWYFTHRCNQASWNCMSRQRAEYWPNRVTVFILRLLFVRARLDGDSVTLPRCMWR